MNSSDIAQMFAAQNQMFMGQNSYAQQIGVSPPMMSGGYMAGGNRFASGAMSAAGGVASIGSSLAFDPLSSFIGGAAGGLARGGISAAMGGGLLAAAPMIPIAAAAQIGIGGLMRGGQQQAAISQNLNSYQFMNSGARGGQGFSRDDSKAIGDQVRALSQIPEMMTSVDELTRLMPRLKQAGVMQGVRSAAEFSQRFKEAVSTIRDISKVMGSTMEEAEQFFASSRSMGFMGRNGALRNTLNAQFTSAQTGMDMGQVTQMQMTGAGMSRQVGGRGAQGASAITSIAQRIEAGRQAGNISEEMIQDVSGQGGALGVQGSAERMYGLMLNMRNTAAGRLVMAGAMKRDASGKVQLDEDVIKKFNTGAIGIEDLKRRASSLSDNDKISFAFRAQGSLGSQLAGSLDAGRMMQGLVGGKGQDAAALVLQRYTGGSEQDIDMMMGLGNAASSGDVSQMAKLKAREADFRERTDPNKIMKRLGTRIRASTTAPIEQAGAKIYSEVAKSFDSVVDEFLGRAVVQVSQQGADSLAKALGGGSKEDLKKIIASASGLKERAAAANSYGIGDAIALGSGNFGAQMGVMSKFAHSLRNTDAAAFLLRDSTNTGRSMEAQAAFTRSITGGEGLSDASRAAQGRLLNAGLGKDAGGAGGVVQRLRADIENFRGMDDERKLVELRGAIQSRIAKGAVLGAGIADTEGLLKILSTEGPGAADKHLKDLGIKGGLKEAIQKMETSDDPSAKDAARLLRTGLSAQQAGASDVLTGIISATQGKYKGGETQVNIAGGLRLGGDVDIKNLVSQSQNEIKASTAVLTSVVGEGNAAVLTASPGARKALKEAIDPKSKLSGAVRAALDLPDKDAAEVLNKLGFAVKPGDIDAMKKMQDQADVGGAAVLKSAIDAHEKGEAVGNYAAISSAAKAKALEIGAAIDQTEGMSPEAKAAATSLQKSLEGLGGNLSTEGVDKVRASMGSLVDELRKGGPGADALVSATGGLGEVAQQSLAGEKKLIGLGGKKGAVTQDMIMKAYGLHDDAATRKALEGVGLVGGTGQAYGDVGEITKKVAGLRGAAKVAGAGQAEAGASESGEQKLLKTLTSIDKTLAQNTAVMVLLANKEGADIDQKKVESSQQLLRENNSPPENSSHS